MFNLFKMFLIVGAISFGGGYAIIPIIQGMLLSRDLLTTEAIQNGVVLSSMLPGSIVGNLASIVGFQITGLLSAFVCMIAISIPSFVYMIIAGRFFDFFLQSSILNNILSILRTIVIALILYAAYTVGFSTWSFQELLRYKGITSIIITIVSLILLIKTKISPFKLLILSGILGVFIF